MNNSEFENIDTNKGDEFNSLKHSVRHKQKERRVRKKRRKVNRWKAFLRFVLTLILFYLVYKFFTLSGWYLPQDVYSNTNSNRVEVSNNNIVPDYYVKNAIKNVKVSKLPIFMTGIKPIQRELYKIPVFKKVYVRRYGFPARIQIIVFERSPIAIIKTSLSANTSAFFTSDGVIVLNQKYMRIRDNSSILKILTTKQSLQKDITVEKINEIREIVGEVEQHSQEKVEYIDMRNSNDIYVKIKTANIRLGMLDSTVYERIKRISTILPQISGLKNKIQYIDLSWDKVNYLKLKK